MKNPWTIIGLLVVVLFGGAIWYSGQANDRNNEGVVVEANVAGNPDATVTLVEYSDLQCPACAAFHPVVKELLSEYGEQIRFEYKHFPIARAHPYATQAAVAAEAAGQQGAFFEFHDLLFENQQQWSSSRTPNLLFLQYAEELNLDIELFRRHQNAPLLQQKVQDEFNEGRQLGVTATPSFFLNGVFMDPAEFGTYQGFVEAVAAAINPAGSGSSTAPVDPSATVNFGI